MSQLLNRANKRISLGGAAALLIGASLFGQVLGFLRTKLINANFPVFGPQSSDAYFAAFKIPDLFFYTIAAGALGVAFIPFISDRLSKNDRNGLWELCSSIMNLLSICMLVVAIVIFVFAEPLIRYLVAPNLTAEQLHNAALIMRIIALNPLLFMLSGILTSVQQTFGRFFFYALAPLFYNAAIIASIFLFKHNLGIVGLGVGAMIGALLQLAISCLGLIGLNFRYWPRIVWKNGNFRLMLKHLPARSIDQGVDSINSIVETNLSSRIGQANITYYENANTLHMAPILLVGSAIATAAFPRLTDRLANNRSDLFRKEFLQVLRTMVWIIAPIVVIYFFARGYLARLIFARGAPEIALILGYLSLAVLFRVLYAIISRWFYAQKDTKTPLFVSLFIIGFNIILAYFLSRPTAYGIAGLAMAQSIIAGIEVIILTAIMLYRDHKLFDKEFLGSMVRILSVTGFSMVTALLMVSLLPLVVTDRGIITLGSKLLAISGATFAVHIGISWLLGLEEVQPIFQKVRKIVLNPIKIS